MDIIVSANNNEEILVFPIIPYDTQLKNPSQNEEFQTVNAGTINLIGDAGLRSVSISSIFPKEKLSNTRYGSVEGKKYVDFFKKWKARKLPIRLVMTLEDSYEWVNMACTIESFDYSYDRKENIRYSLELKEYIFIL